MNTNEDFLDDILKEFGSNSEVSSPSDEDIRSILEEFNITPPTKKEPTYEPLDATLPISEAAEQKNTANDNFEITSAAVSNEELPLENDTTALESKLKDIVINEEIKKNPIFTPAKMPDNISSTAFDNIIDELSKISLASDSLPAINTFEETSNEPIIQEISNPSVTLIVDDPNEPPVTLIIDPVVELQSIPTTDAFEQESDLAEEILENANIKIKEQSAEQTYSLDDITFGSLNEMPDSLHIKNTTETRLDAFFDGYDNSDFANITIDANAFSNIKDPSEFTDSFSSYRDFSNSMTSGNIFSGLLGKLLNEKEDTEEPIPEYVSHKMPEIDDFTCYEDTQTVLSDLKHLKQSAFFRSVFATVFTALLFYLNIGALTPSILPDFLKPSTSFFGFGATSVILLLGLVFAGAGTFFESIMKLFSLRPTGDSLASVAIIFSIFQGIYIATSTATNNATPLVVSAIAALAFTFSIYIKLMQINTVLRGFNIISDKGNKHTIVDVNSNELPVELKDNEKDLAVVAKTAFVENYLENSFCPNPSYNINRILTLIALIGTLITGIVGFVFHPIPETSAFYNALIAICSASCISACFLNSATFILPSFIQNLKSTSKGGVVVGYDSVIKAKEILGVITTDSQLLNSHESHIGGMKMLAGSEIYDIVTKLASVYHEIGGTLSDTFLKILDNKKALLQKVTSVDIEEGEGICAVISGLKIHIGTSKYLITNGIIMPSTDFEKKFANETKKVIQVGFDGELRAIFVVEYKSGDNEYECIDMIDSLGLTVIAYSEDFNVNADTIKSALEAPNTDILEYGSATASKFKELLSEKPRTKASINSNTGLLGIVHAIRAARGISRSFKILSIIKCINVILGLVLCAVMFYSGSPLPFVQLLTYQSIWTILGIALSLF